MKLTGMVKPFAFRMCASPARPGKLYRIEGQITQVTVVFEVLTFLINFALLRVQTELMLELQTPFPQIQWGWHLTYRFSEPLRFAIPLRFLLSQKSILPSIS